MRLVLQGLRGLGGGVVAAEEILCILLGSALLGGLPLGAFRRWLSGRSGGQSTTRLLVFLGSPGTAFVCLRLG